MRKLLSRAKNREIIIRNPLEKIGKLHKLSRKDIIWMPSQVNKLLHQAAPHLADIVRFALWAMQRKGNILGLTTLAYSTDCFGSHRPRQVHRSESSRQTKLCPGFEKPKKKIERAYF